MTALHPFITAALADDHRTTLLARAEVARRGALAKAGRSGRSRLTPARRTIYPPRIALRGWLARGYR